MGDESPRNKVKFLCSYGGKVLPRPSDGVLKYVGGETRVICVPRDINFSEVMKKVSGMTEYDVVLKYQMVPEDLDALVSVKTDEDLKHMIEEHDRHESAGTPLLRAFLFPLKPISVDNQHQQHQIQVLQPPPCEPYLLEQRYIDAVNGIIRTSPRAKQNTVCSACSSPKSNSPDGHTGESPLFQSSQPGRLSTMSRVRSSPSLTNLNNNNPHDHGGHHHYPLAYPSSSSSSYRPPQDPQLGLGGGIGIGMVRPPPQVMTDIGRGGFNYYYSTPRPHKGYNAHQDDSVPYGHVMFERVHSVPRSPRKSIWE